jgi:hypothetical protein
LNQKTYQNILHKHQNHNKFLELRAKYPYFIFQSYHFERTKHSLKAAFTFNLSDEFIFKPGIEIPSRSFYNFDKMGDTEIDLLVFHIGMVELVSYWKTSCSPKVIIEPHALDSEQIKWWKKLYFHGLGEFFYLNDIHTSQNDFMMISAHGPKTKPSKVKLDESKVLLPIGGGKDSIVSLELLKKGDFEVKPFIVNPREASLRTIEIGGFTQDESVIVNRHLDKKLLELNEKGFLNGHTPFSALLAFISSFTALASGTKYIALSNENSANESTVPGSKINHQYSKSLEFEDDFAWYINKFIHPKLYYFSFLRPLNELQIAAIFSKFPQHFFSFRSCNVGSKTDSWCGHCPKCLFTYTILSPFVKPETLEKIFGANLLDDVSLKPIMDELDGETAIKPFECVGTPLEVNASLWHTQQKSVKNLPKLLVLKNQKNQEETFQKLLTNRMAEHRLPEPFYKIMGQAIDDIAKGTKK